MPLTQKGKKIKRNMRKTYGEEKGDEVFYASQNSGKVTGTHVKKRKKSPRKKSGTRKRTGKTMY